MAIWRVVKVHSKASVSYVGVCGTFIPMARHSTGGSKWRNLSEATDLLYNLVG